MKIYRLLLLVSIVPAWSFCDGQTPLATDWKQVDRYRNEILPERDMRATAEQAIKRIQERDYTQVKALFAEDIARALSDQQIAQLVDQINLLFQTEGVPAGNENILPGLGASVRGKDTVFVNHLMYMFKPVTDGTSSSQRVLTFSFLKKYGTQKLVGINLKQNPSSAPVSQPAIKPLQQFTFTVSDITHFRIYYDEGADRHTQFKNEIGYFAIEGGPSTLEESGIKSIVLSVFADLAQSKVETVAPFSTLLLRGDRTKFIQAEFALRNQPYTLFIYLPLQQEGPHSNKIIVRQCQYANLGYEFVLDQKQYPAIVSEFPKIARLKLDRFYAEKP